MTTEHSKHLFALFTLVLSLTLASQAVAQDETSLQETDTPDTEAPRGSLRLGIGYDAYAGLVGEATVAHGGLFGQKGLTASLSTRYDQYSFLHEVHLGGTTALHDHWFWDVSTHYKSLSLNHQTDLRGKIVGGSALAGLQLTPKLRWTLGSTLHRYETEEASVLSGIESLREDDPRTNLGLWTEAEYRSNPQPAGRFLRGLHLKGRAEYVLPFADEDTGFFREEIKASLGIPLVAGLHLQLNASGGAIQAEDRASIPFFERYRLGGPQRFGGNLLPAIGRGLSTPEGTIPFGGEQVAVGSVELSIPLLPEAGVYAFAGLETGALRTQMSQGGADNDFQSTAYGGLRWFSPIGKIDVAAGSSFTRGDAEPMILFTLGGQ